MPRVGKAVVVSSNHSLSVSAYGRLVPSTVYTTNLAIEMKSYNDLKCLLDYIERLKPCEGCPAKLHPHISSSSVALKDGDKWRRKTCTTLSLNSTCPECRTLHKLFLQRTKKCHGRKSRAKTSCIKSLRRKAIRATLRRVKSEPRVSCYEKAT